MSKSKNRKETFYYVHKYFLRYLFLLAVIIFTVIYLRDYLFVSTLEEKFFNLFVYVGGGYALLRMGDWI